jgi:hypothetical protein
MSVPNAVGAALAVVVAFMVVKICQRSVRSVGNDLTKVGREVEAYVRRSLQRIREDGRWQPER